MGSFTSRLCKQSLKFSKHVKVIANEVEILKFQALKNPGNLVSKPKKKLKRCAILDFLEDEVV